MIDANKMSGLEILNYCQDNAAKWAECFCQIAKKLGIENIDEGWMIGWFANAIEHSEQVRNEKRSDDYILVNASDYGNDMALLNKFKKQQIRSNSYGDTPIQSHHNLTSFLSANLPSCIQTVK